MADKTILASLIITAEVDAGPFATAMGRLSQTTITNAATMRQHLDTTSASVAKLVGPHGVASSNSFRPYAFLALSRAMGDTNARANLLRSTFLGLAGTVAGFTGALGVSAILAYADTYTTLQNRLSLVTTSSANLNAVQGLIYESTIQTGAGIKDAVDAYVELATASTRLGLSQSQLIRINETIQKTFRLSGASGTEAAAATTQLAVGIASNNIQGQQLRPILRNQELAKVFADQISGGSVQALREMAKQGELTGQVMTKALLGAGDEIDKKFGTVIPTITVGLKDLDNAMTMFIGKQDTSLGASRMLANGLELLAANIGNVGSAVILIGEALLLNFGLRAANSISGVISKAALFNQQMVYGAAAAQLETLALKDDAAASLAAAAARVKMAEANSLMTRGGGTLGFGSSASAVTAERELLAARVAMAGVTSTAAAANAAYAASSWVAAKAVIGEATGLTALGGALSRTVALLGGPLNAAITVAFVGYMILTQWQGSAARAAATHESALQTLDQRIVEATSKTKEFNDETQRTVDMDMAAAIQGQTEAYRAFVKTIENYRTVQRDIGKSPVADLFDKGGTERLQQASTTIIIAQNALGEWNQRVQDFKDRAASLKKAVDAPTQSMNDAAAATAKFTKEMAKLQEEAASGPLTDFEKQVTAAAETAGVAQEVIDKYIAAAKQGRGGLVGGVMGDISDLQTQIDAWTEYKSMLTTLGPTASMLSEKQAQLNVLVKAGAITAGQSKTAFGDYLGTFSNYKWIDDLTTATDAFATSAIDDFSKIGDAFAGLLKTMAKDALTQLALTPFNNWIKGILGGALGGIGGAGGALPNYTMGGLMHSGGTVGSTSVPMRALPSSAWRGAPRFAGGMGPDEFTAILHRGEQVLTEAEAARTKNVLGGMAGRGMASPLAMTFAPTYHLPGATTEAVQMLAGVVANQQRTFAKDVGTVVAGMFSRGKMH